MITGIAFAAILATVPMLGGNLRSIGKLRLEAPWAVLSALIIQVTIINLTPAALPETVANLAHLSSYGLAAWFAWRNRAIAGLSVVLTGGAMNLTAIAANGGVMPMSPEALERAGKIVSAVEFENSYPMPDARLAWLGDVFAVPAGVPFANVFSPGDVVLVLGSAIVLHAASGSWCARSAASAKCKVLGRDEHLAGLGTR